MLSGWGQNIQRARCLQIEASQERFRVGGGTRAWQTPLLEAIYPIVWLDGIVVKVQQNKQVINKSAHDVLGVNLRGQKEVLGL